MRTLVIISALVIGASTVASAQFSSVDRNFERLDQIRSAPRKALLAATEPNKDVRYWQLGVALSEPDASRGYGTSISYTDMARGIEEGYHTFQATAGVTWPDPMGGSRHDIISGIATYQVSRDRDLAVTPGIQIDYRDEFAYILSPSVAASKNLSSDGQVKVTPTLSYLHVNSPGNIGSQLVPDVMLLYSPKSQPLLNTSFDYVVATPIGRNTFQLAAAYAFSKKVGASSFKLAINMSATGVPQYIGLLQIKLK